MDIKFSYDNGILNILKCHEVFDKNCYNYINDKMCEESAWSDISSCVRKIIFPDNVKVIESDVFKDHIYLNNVKFPINLEIIGSSAFANCSLTHIDLPEGIKKIGSSAFVGNEFKKLDLPSSLVEINSGAFHACNNIESIVIPGSVKEIGNKAFYECDSLKKIVVENGVEKLGDYCFSYANCGSSVKLPNSLKEIGSWCFYGSKINSLVIPDSVVFIGEGAFSDCYCLDYIQLSSSIKRLYSETFCNCIELDSINIPDNVEVIEQKCFSSCKLSNFTFSNNLKRIGRKAFSNTYLTEVDLPDSLEILDDYAFCSCVRLKSLYLNDSLKTIGEGAFLDCSISYINIPKSVEKVKDLAFCNSSYNKVVTFNNQLDLGDNVFGGKISHIYFNGSNKTLRFDSHNSLFFPSSLGPVVYDGYSDLTTFYIGDKVVSDNVSDFLEQYASKTNGIQDFSLPKAEFPKIYRWSLMKKFLPHYSVMLNMPVNDIGLFYLNNNSKKWAEILRHTPIQFDENKATLFKLCYVLGVFQESSSKRDEAVEYIKKHILSKLNENEIHSKFDGFDLSNGFDPMWAEFFMKYYKDTPGFMKNMKKDYLCASYNNFSFVKKYYPGKVVNTNRDADILLPSHVISVIDSREYDFVNEGNKEFALLVGKYGYSQDQFEKLQEWFDAGKSILKSNLKIFIKDDIKDDNNVTYDLLEKDNPLGAVLGNITNCCQIVGGAGASCVKYGMTKPNSKFMTFNMNKQIIGQAWVWYDEVTGVVCLDNIEVPEKYLYKIKHNVSYQTGFVECLKRMSNNFVDEMKEHGLVVNKVTVGEGYNDIKDILDNNFKKDDNVNRLSFYEEYSDAKYGQYIINEKKK